MPHYQGHFAKRLIRKSSYFDSVDQKQIVHWSHKAFKIPRPRNTPKTNLRICLCSPQKRRKQRSTNQNKPVWR